MSGMIMVRQADGITLLSDGGCYRSTADFTVTGFASKPMVFPHLSMVICSIGCTTTNMLVDHCLQRDWTSFDNAKATIRKRLRDVIATVWQLDPKRDHATNYIFIGGYSEKRERWESYNLMLDCPYGRDPAKGIGRLYPGAEVMIFPMPEEAGLKRYGFTPPNVQFTDFRNDLINFMRAQRATPQEMGAIGDSEPDLPKGHTLGGFMELITLRRHSALSEIVWQWPDKSGRMINPKREGEAVKPALTLAA